MIGTKARMKSSRAVFVIHQQVQFRTIFPFVSHWVNIGEMLIDSDAKIFA